MAKKKKIVTKAMAKKLSKSWIGLVALVAILLYQVYVDNKPITPGIRYEVALVNSIDGDTATFLVEGKEVKVRFLYIDTPESTKQVEPYGVEIAEYVEKRLENASVIELETNVDGDQYDKYDRMLAWVFVDGTLLQVELAEKGYVKKFYDYHYEYTYKEEIVEAHERAVENRVGIYAD